MQRERERKGREKENERKMDEKVDVFVKEKPADIIGIFLFIII